MSDSCRPTLPDLCLIDRSDRSRIEITGPDRAKFLHNLTTNEVKRLPAGRGCEAFVTSAQGKTIGYVTILADENRILVRTDPGGMELALPHLTKYGMFDDVTIEDRSEATFELHILGEGVDALVRRGAVAPPDAPELTHRISELGGRPVRLVREAPAGIAGITILGERADADTVTATLAAFADGVGLAVLEPAEFEALRIEAGTPAFGKDITEKNLPQEFARDDRAISFIKGCYLGQETVARIDALGHVNQFLRGLTFEPGSCCPAPGASLEADGKRVGAITSAADSPWRGHPVALAMVRAAHARAGTPLSLAVEGSDRPLIATVVDLPFPPRA